MVFLIFLSSLLLYLSFPNIFNRFGYSFFAWIFAIPLFFAFDGIGKHEVFLTTENRSQVIAKRFSCKYNIIKRLRAGLVWGIVFYSFLVSWLIPYSPIGYILFVAILCIQPVLFALLYRKEHKYKILNIFYIPALWVASEYLRLILLKGFSWDIGHSQSFHTYIIQISNLIGSSGVSFIVVLVNYCLYEFIVHKEKQNFFGISILTIILLVFAYGHISIEDNPRGALHICTIQPNTRPEDKMDPEKIPDFVAQNILLSEECVRRYEPHLIVWPETAIPADILEDPVIKNRIKKLALQTQSHLLIGAALFNVGKDHNSAVLINPSGNVVDIYHKEHLIPLSEYIPENWFWKLVEELFRIESFDFNPGTKEVLFTLNRNQQWGETPEKKFGVMICSEETLSFLFKNQVRNGADFIISILNDGWFNQEGALVMHTQSAIMHAVENRLPVVRAANTGWSTYIDSYGRLSNIRKPELNTQKVFFHKVSFTSTKTFYNTIGYIFPKLCLIFVIMVCLRMLLKRYLIKGK